MGEILLYKTYALRLVAVSVSFTIISFKSSGNESGTISTPKLSIKLKIHIIALLLTYG